MSDTVHILVAHNRPDIVSGAELAIADFVDLVDGCFRITMLTPGEGKLSDYYRQRGFEIWEKLIQTRRRRYPGLHTIQSLLFARDLKEREVDAVLCNTLPAENRVGTACRRANIPYGIYVRDYISDHSRSEKKLGRSDKVFAVSRDVRNSIISMVNPSKIVVAYDYIDECLILDRAAFHKVSGMRLLPFGEEHPVVGIVGRITPYKQQDLFVRSIPGILSEVPDARFVVVGSAIEKDKDYESYVKSTAINLGIQNQVEFMGYRKDAIEITSELSVACLTSDREPLGRVILEAQLLGCPVVVADTGGPPEIVEDEVNGLLFSSTASNAEDQLAIQVVRLLKNQEQREDLIARAKESVQATFAGKIHVRKLERYLEDLSQKDDLVI